ncbi:MAG TPA: hypothetical protein VEL78_08555 [Pyrinomonadaceae bacterium]|nr:hypothetical protein [Pyrinomonadaceae bacterium]
MRKSTIYLFILGVAVMVMAAIASAGFVASAQNSNSSTTNMNMAKPKPRHRRPKKPATTTGDTGMATPQKTGKCDPTKQEQTDLSGTYTGKLKHGDEPVQDATLTITGNSFTGSMGGQTVSGRIVAVTTCGYTAVTIMHEGESHAMSLRAKKVGDNLTLTSVPGEPQKITFTTGGGAMKPKPRKRKAKANKPVAPPPPTKTTP